MLSKRSINVLVGVSRCIGLQRRKTAALISRQGGSLTYLSTAPMSKLKSLDTPSAFDNLIIKKGATLPYVHTVRDGMQIRIDHITEEFAEQAWNIIHASTQTGDGYSASELEPLETFLQNTSTMKSYFQIVDCQTNQLVFVLALKPTPLARSENTVHFTSFVGMDPKYRGKGLGSKIIPVLNADLGRSILGFPGFTVARAAMSRGIHAVVLTGCPMLGTIQNCSYLEGKGWVPDVVFSNFHPSEMSHHIRVQAPGPLPPLQIENIVSTDLQTDNPRLTDFPPLELHGTVLPVELASPDDVWRVEEMIRLAAEGADGFAIDEFNTKGHFNRRLLYDSNVIVAKNGDKSVVAAAIFGSSRLSRAYNHTQAGGYVIVANGHRGKGVGSAFSRYLLDLAPEAGFKSIVTDAYVTNTAGLRLLQANNFISTATMPHCGFMKDRGLTDSLINYISL